MPLFGSKFSPKKTPLRKSSSSILSVKDEKLFSEQRAVKLSLGEQELTFENGEWVTGAESGQSSSTHHAKKLRKKIQDLQEENNMLKLKYTIMLNMLTETTAESHLQERELDKLRKINNK